MRDFDKLLADEGVQPRLFDAWNLHADPEVVPEKPEWPEPLDDYSTRQRELWGYLAVARRLLREMDGARAIYRGDSLVMTDGTNDRSFYVGGDLDLAWQGRAPIVEVKAYLPALRVKSEGRLIGPSQGLDYPRHQDYLNEQTRTGRPFYVVWVWPVGVGDVSMAGERIDRLAWPTYESLNRRRDQKGAKMCYWPIRSLLSVPEIAEDVESWSGAPFQETLAV